MAEETKLKVGDILTCHSKVIMEHNGGIKTTICKSYKIVKILYLKGEAKLVIKNDYNEDHRFTYKNYNKWFYNLKELRLNKLKKIQNV